MGKTYIDKNGITYELLMTGTNDDLDEKQAVYKISNSEQTKIESFSKFMERFDYEQTDASETHLTTQEKLSIYNSRFNARKDVYAKRYFNKKQQRDVYSPAVTFSNNRPILMIIYP